MKIDRRLRFHIRRMVKTMSLNRMYTERNLAGVDIYIIPKFRIWKSFIFSKLKEACYLFLSNDGYLVIYSLKVNI